MGQLRPGLAERQPQRQQLALPGRRHRAVPPRVRGPAAGAHSIHINYDFTAGGHKAYDFLATWNVTNAAGKTCAASGGGISSMCPSMPASSVVAFPSDGFKVNGLPSSGAETYSGRPAAPDDLGRDDQSHRRSEPTPAPPNGNSTADFAGRLQVDRQRRAPGLGRPPRPVRLLGPRRRRPADGAAQVSGAPWHMRTLQLDGAGNKNQDRSIQPSAIVGELATAGLAPGDAAAHAAPTPPRRARRRADALVDPSGRRRPTSGPGGGPHRYRLSRSTIPRLTPPATSTEGPVGLARPEPTARSGAAVAIALLVGVILRLACQRPFERRRRRR